MIPSSFSRAAGPTVRSLIDGSSRARSLYRRRRTCEPDYTFFPLAIPIFGGEHIRICRPLAHGLQFGIGRTIPPIARSLYRVEAHNDHPAGPPVSLENLHLTAPDQVLSARSRQICRNLFAV